MRSATPGLVGAVFLVAAALLFTQRDAVVQMGLGSYHWWLHHETLGTGMLLAVGVALVALAARSLIRHPRADFRLLVAGLILVLFHRVLWRGLMAYSGSLISQPWWIAEQRWTVLAMVGVMALIGAGGIVLSALWARR